MSDPLTFDSATARHSLPLLFPGQAQKEFFVNEALNRIDALLHCTVEGVVDAPPASPEDGKCWLVGSAPTGAWSDEAGNLVCRQLGSWLFLTPRDGLAVLNRATGQIMRFSGGWSAPAAPIVPTNGASADSELRVAFGALLDALTEAGIFGTV